MIGTYTVRDESGRDLSETDSYRGARVACRVHLSCDGEEPPLSIWGPDGRKIATAHLDHCNNVVIRSDTTDRRYEEVVKIWGRPVR